MRFAVAVVNPHGQSVDPLPAGTAPACVRVKHGHPQASADTTVPNTVSSSPAPTAPAKWYPATWRPSPPAQTRHS